MCKERGPNVPMDNTIIEDGGTTVGNGNGRKLSVTLKRLDVDKTLEERVMVNKSSFSTFMKRHAEWKSPGSGRKIGIFEDVVEEERSVSPSASRSISKFKEPRPNNKETKGDGWKVAVEVSSSSALHKERSISKGTISNALLVELESEVDDASMKGIGVPRRSRQGSETSKQEDPSFRKDRTASYSPPSILNRDISSMTDDSFQDISSAEAVPSIKLPQKAIPASQPSDSSQISSSLINEIPSPPAVRQRSHPQRKRNLVIEDSEDESPAPKRTRMFISPRAAMKSAPSGRVLEKPAPIKVPDVSQSESESVKGEFAKKRSIVAKKSGTKFRESTTPVSEKEDVTTREKDSDVETTDTPEKGMNLQSPPVSPIQYGKRRLPEPASPMSEIRPSDPGENQRFSLQLIMSSGNYNDIPIQVDNVASGFTFTTPYPDCSAVLKRPSAPPSPKRTRSQDKKNFDILSLVPKDAVPVIEDGKLAFREGCIDFKTGRLKRGVKKFKVGRIIPGELF